MNALAPIHTPLGFGTSLEQLATRDGLIALDRSFLARLAAEAPELHTALLTARATPESLDAKAESELLVLLGPVLDDFVAELFGLDSEIAAIAAETAALDPVHACKRLFVQRQAVKKHPDPSGFDGLVLRAALEALLGAPLTELGFAQHVTACDHA